MIFSNTVKIDCRDCVLRKPCFIFLEQGDAFVDDSPGATCMLAEVMNRHLSFLEHTEKTIALEFDTLQDDKDRLYEDMAELLTRGEQLGQWKERLADEEDYLHSEREEIDRLRNELEDEGLYTSGGGIREPMPHPIEGECPPSIVSCGYKERYEKDELSSVEFIEICRDCGDDHIE